MKTIKLISIFILSQAMAFCTKTDIGTENRNNTPGIPGNGTSKIVVIHDEVEGVAIVLAGSVESRFIVSFKNDLDGFSSDFTPIQNSLPLIMEDSEGNKWDITGLAVEGPRKGEKLKPTSSFMGYWFSWGTFFPGAKIYGNTDLPQQKPRVYLTGDWLVPPQQVLSGGPGKDGIPALKNPEFLNKIEASYMNDDDLILGFMMGTEARAYPHKILDWHEIINDEIQEKKITVTYCPLTGTGIGWAQNQNGESSSFGVSGLLYNSNLIPYDRKTDSYWSQIRLDCIKGERKGEKISTFQLIETTWGTWKKTYPNTRVVSTNTGHSRNYNRYPYGDYKTDETVYFPVSDKDNRLHAKEVVHGIIINDKATVYRYEHFN